MAKKLKHFDWAANKKNGGPRQGKYPWEKWLDGNIWQLTNGHDFTSKKVENFRISCVAAAKRQGLKCRTAVVSEKILVIQAYKPEESDA